MSNITVEKNIPLTPSRLDHSKRWVEPKWPWRKMDLGDSFLVPDKKSAVSAWASFNTIAKSKNSPFAPSWSAYMRKQSDGTFRLWLADKNLISSK